MVKLKKQAQIKIQQMAFMLMAITLFFVLVGMFVLVFGFSNLKQRAQILEDTNAMLLVTKLANSPEFSCGDAFASKVNCVDADKVMVLKDNVGRYGNFWGVGSIEIRKIYPDKGNVLCTLQNYDSCGVIEVFKGAGQGILPATSNFVSLCKKQSENSMLYEKCELARLIVSPRSVK